MMIRIDVARLRRGSRRPGWSAWSVLVAVALSACQADAPTSTAVSVHAASLAKGGGGGTTGAAPTVTSTTPSAAKQDTTVDVAIYGSGFASGATAVWSLGGDTTRVHVLSTKFVSSTQLVSRIIVPTDAPVASYDVEVMLIGGKKGVGAEMFEVLVGDPKATFLYPLADASLNVRSDGLFSDGTYSVYANGVCGVVSKIYATTEQSNTGDATMGTYQPRTKDRTCATYPRRIRIIFPDGFTETTHTGTNLRFVENSTSSIPVGATVKRALHVGVGESVRCEGLVWSANRTGTPVPGDSVLVTRLAEDRWHVQSQPYPNNRAYCWPNGPAYNMTVELTVVSSRPLP